MEIGPYTIERELGRGGMGAVYLGRLPGSSVPHAIKVVHADLASDPDLLARFEREGAVLARLDHPNLVSFHGRGRFSGGLWLAMDYVAGESLEDRISRSGPLPSPLAGELLTQVAAGLAHAHRAGILHRDLKPANVLLRAGDGQALLADFGLALPLDVSQHLTRTGEVLGSPGYLAPEQCGIGGGSTPATDVYGLGALLYAALTGSPPLKGRSLLETLDHVLTRRPRPPRELVPDVDPTLEAICLRCLEKEPSERYGDAQEVLEALSSEAAPPRRRGGTLLAVAGVGLVGLAAGVALSTLEDAPSPSPSETQEIAASPTPSRSASPAISIAEALRTQDWRAGHVRAMSLSGAEGHWARYRLLAGELEATGTEGEDWVAARAVALESCVGSQGARAWGALIRSLVDPLLGERAGVQELKRLAGELELAQAPGGPSRDADQRRALLRARAEIALRIAELARKGRDWGRVEERHAAWALEEQGSWRVEMMRAQIYAGRGKRNLAMRALRVGETAAQRRGHPWARFVLYELRSRWLLRPGRVRRDQVMLARAILAAPDAPRSLQVRVSYPLAAHLITNQRAQEAVSLLEQLKPSSRASQTLRFNWLLVAAQAFVEGGAPGRLLSSSRASVLEGRGAGELQRLKLLETVALCLLNRTEEAWALWRTLPPSSAASLALLELWAAALLGDGQRFERAYAGSGRWANTVSYRWDQLRRLESLHGKARLNLAPILAKLQRGLQKELPGLINGLLKKGRWEESFLALERLGGVLGSDRDTANARIACRILEIARQDEEPSSRRFGEAQERARGYVARLAIGSSAARGLGAVIEALGDPPDARLASLHRDLDEAGQRHPGWDQLPRVHLRLLRSWHERVAVVRGLAGHQRRIAERWSYASKSFEVRLEVLLNPGPPDLPTLSNLAREAAANKDPIQRVAAREACRVRHGRGELTSEHFVEFLCAEANWEWLLRADRREVLLQAAELFEPPEAYPHEILSFLARIQAWCGVPQDMADLARYRRLESIAYVALGRNEEALGAGRSLAELSQGLAAELRAPHLAQLGRAEVLAAQTREERAAGLARIRRALELHPHGRGFVLLARSLEGEARAEAYRKALEFPTPPGWGPRLLSEIREAQHEPAALLREALFGLEARSRDSDCGLRLAQALFEGDPTRGHAELLWETYAIGGQASSFGARDLDPKSKRRVREAAAKLTPEDKRVADALQELRDIRARAASGTFADPAAELDRAIAALLAAAEGSRGFADRLRIPVHLCEAFDILGRLRPELTWEYVKRNLQELRSWSERGPLPWRVPILLAFHYRVLGKFRPAAQVLSQAASGPLKVLPELQGRAILDYAVNLSDLSEEERALQLAQRASELLTDQADLARAFLLAAQILLRAGRPRDAMGAAQTASDHCPRTAEEQTLFVRTQICWGRILVARGRKEQAALMTSKLTATYTAERAEPLLVGMIRNLEGEIAFAQGRLEEALTKAKESLKFQPAQGEAHVTCVLALAAGGQLADARAWGQAALGDERLTPRDKVLIQSALRYLEGR